MVPAPGAGATASCPPGDGFCGVISEDGGTAFIDPPPTGPRPSFPATVTASVPPPPISGGTLLVTRDGTTAVAADPDRDAVYVVDVAGMTLRSTITLKAGDEPGRLVEDGEGRVHVALRGSGALVTLDPATGTVLARRAVCPAPRGVVWDSTSDSLWVACATGELVQLPAAGGAPTQSVTVERDLRDVLLVNGALSVTSFRSAQVLRLNSDGTVRHDQLGSPDTTFVPQVAWRAVAGPRWGHLRGAPGGVDAVGLDPDAGRIRRRRRTARARGLRRGQLR